MYKGVIFIPSFHVFTVCYLPNSLRDIFWEYQNFGIFSFNLFLKKVDHVGQLKDTRILYFNV